MASVQNIQIDPQVVTWGQDVAQVEKITCVADSSGSLNNTYFFLYEPDGTGRYIWFNVASGGSDPSIAGFTGVEVALSTDDSANTVASAVQSAIDGLANFSASVSLAVVTVTNSNNGYAQAAHNGTAGFSFEVSVQGNDAAEVGFVDGDIELSVPEDLVDVTAHETGTNVLSQIRTGKQIELTVNFKETSAAQLRKVFRQAGSSFTPAGASGTEVSGYGESKDFTQTITQASKLVLHPKKLSSSDKSRDYTFHLAYPQLESLSYSGENILTIPLTFKVYPDTSLNSAVQYFAYGDGSQTLT